MLGKPGFFLRRWQDSALASDKLEEVLTELQTIISRQATIIASLQEEMAETNEILEDVHVLRQLEDDR